MSWALYIFCQNEADFKLYIQESRPYAKSKDGELRQR